MLQKTSIFSDFLSTNSFYKTQLVFSWIQPRGVLRNPTLKGSKPSLPVECRTRTVSKSSMQQSLHQSKQPNHHQSKPKQTLHQSKHQVINKASMSSSSKYHLHMQQNINQESSPSVAHHRQNPPRYQPKLGHHTKLQSVARFTKYSKARARASQ